MLPLSFIGWQACQQSRSRFSRLLRSISRALRKSPPTNLIREGFQAVESSARLQSLLAQHRQIVESAPAEVDRKRLEISQREFISKSSQLSALLNELNQQKSDQTTDEMEAQITKEIPALGPPVKKLCFMRIILLRTRHWNCQASYAKIANDLEDKIHQYRDHRIRVATASVATLINSAQSLLFWVSISALAAFLLIGPLGLTMTRGVLGRLNRITTYMTRLANQTAAEEVPSRDDRDEVGDMARAVQVFKENAAELLERKLQLEQVNVQLDLALNNMTHGLCMFDLHRRLIICNDHYAKMYSLPAELTTPGTELNAILQYLIDKETFAETSEETLTGTDTFAANGNGKLCQSTS